MSAANVVALLAGAASLVLSGLAFWWAAEARRIQRERARRERGQ